VSGASNPLRGHPAPGASRWLSAPRGSFKPAPGLNIAPHLQLVRPVTGAPGLNVWVADQLTLQIEVAVKFSPPDGSSPAASTATAEDVHRFLHQARCAARIGDPHLLQVLEQGRVRGVPFIVTPLREGRSLNQRLLAGPLSSFEVHALLEQATGVLAKAHSLGLFHGSLCPEHLFLTETAGQPFLEIANFGDVSSDTWADHSSPGLAPDAPSRKQAYLSPEQLLQGTGSSAAADLWALGVATYELLTLTLPFEAPTAEGVRVAICNGQFAPPSRYRADLPPAIDIWFARVFAKEFAARLLDPRRFASEFARALGGAVSGARAEIAGASASYPDHDGAAPRELDSDFESEERTVRWDLPSEWAPAHPLGSQHPPTERSPAPSPSSAPPLPPPARSVPPPLPSNGPPPLPDRPPSSRPPPVAGYAAISFPPPPRVSSALLLEAARATAAPRAPSSGLAHFFQINRTRGLVAGALLGAGAAFLAWGYQTWPDNEGSTREEAASAVAPATEITAEARLRSSAVGGSSTAGTARAGTSSTARSTARNGAHPISGPRADGAAEELPVILQTDDLPQAPDDGFEDDEGSAAESGSVARSGGLAGAHGPRTAKSDPRPAVAATKVEPRAAAKNGKGDARPEPAVRATAAVAKPTSAPRRETASHGDKHSAASADCNPPYFFDNNNIRRLKLECL